MAAHGHTNYKPGEVAWGAEHHILPIRVYVNTILALFVLMVLTILAAEIHMPDIHLGGKLISGTIFNNLIAMAIAVTKASLVVMFFMHVKFASSLVKFWAIVGFVWVCLLAFILADYATRPLDPTVARPWMNDPGSSLPKQKGSPQSESVDPELNVNIRPRQ
jgi:cytochrome c oxidase subunit IV